MKTKFDIEREWSPSDYKNFFNSRRSLSSQASERGYAYSTAFRHFSKCPEFAEWVKSFYPLSKADESRYRDVVLWCREAGVVPRFDFSSWYGLVYYQNGKTISYSYEVECPECHQVFETSFRSSVPHMTQCPNCGYHGKGMASYAKFSVEDRVKKQLKDLGYELVSKFTSSHDLHVVRCLKCGVEFSTVLTRNHFHNCPYCSESHSSINQKSKIDKLCEQYNYTFLDTWDGKNSSEGKLKKYKFKCNVCGTVFESFVNGHQLQLCPHCKSSEYRSNRERKIDTLLSLCGVKHFSNYRFTVGGKIVELDCYCPDLGVAFEFNGYYWHNSGTYEHSKPIGYHKFKTDECLKRGIRLYHIWEDTSDELATSIVLSKVGKAMRVFARKCLLMKISSSEAKQFLSTHHVDGYVRSVVNYALVLDDKIQCCLSLNRRRIQSTGEIQWEIARFASAFNTVVVGGYSRLLNRAMQFLREQGCHTLVSYCNRDLSPDYTNTFYYKYGFEFVKDSGPIYKYWASQTVQYLGKQIDRNSILSRQDCQKFKLLSWFKDEGLSLPKDVSEFSLATELGFQPCYNSGNYKFVLHL